MAFASAICALALGVCAPAPAMANPQRVFMNPVAASSDPTPTLSGNTNVDGTAVTVTVYRGTRAEGEIAATLEVPAIEVSNKQWSGTLQEPLQAGVYTAVARQEVEEGSIQSEPVTFTIEPGPAASIDPLASPTNDATPELSGTAGTDPHDLKEVEVVIYAGATAGGTVIEAQTVAVTAGEWSFTPPHALADGTYTAVASQSNEAAETRSSAPVTFTVDTTPPRVSIRTPAGDEVIASANATYAGTPGSEPGDLPSITLTVYVGTKAPGPTVQVIRVSAAQWSSGVAAPALANGIYTAVAEQADAAGNVGSSQVTFAIGTPRSIGPSGTAPPTASFEWFPAHPLTGEPVSLVSTSTDLESPITALAWALGSGGPFGPGTSVYTTSFARSGKYQFRLRVSNAAGLASIASEIIDVSARTATLVQPFPVVRIAGSDTRRGTKVALLTVQAPQGASVQVSCRGRGCPAKRISERTVSHPGASGTALLTFGRFERLLHPGAVLEVRVSKPGQIGKYTSFTVHRGKLPTRIDECLGGTQPIRCPG